MVSHIEVTQKRNVSIEDYWVIRGVLNSPMSGKMVVREKEYLTEPTKEDIALFLVGTKCTFASIEHNYRFFKG